MKVKRELREPAIQNGDRLGEYEGGTETRGAK
jgi:hypothetical protein